MIIEALDNIEEGSLVGGELIKEVWFADDQALISSTEHGL
jgi:hypothetical protein